MLVYCVFGFGPINIVWFGKTFSTPKTYCSPRSSIVWYHPVHECDTTVSSCLLPSSHFFRNTKTATPQTATKTRHPISARWSRRRATGRVPFFCLQHPPTKSSRSIEMQKAVPAVTVTLSRVVNLASRTHTRLFFHEEGEGRYEKLLS